MPGDAGGRPLDQVYNQTRSEGLHAGADTLRRELTIQGTLGYVRPGVPVRTPPNVMAVWIPAFVNTEGDMVSGHWVYMVRQQEKWFIEEETGPGTAAVTVPHSSPRPRQSATVPPERPIGPPSTTGGVLNPATLPSVIPTMDTRTWNPPFGMSPAQTTTPPTLIPPLPRVPVSTGGQP